MGVEGGTDMERGARLRATKTLRAKINIVNASKRYLFVCTESYSTVPRTAQVMGLTKRL